MTQNHDVSHLPLRALQIFEAAARLQGFTAAGLDLGITQSAVSRKISELELLLDVRLFLRSGPNISLTQTGRVLADRVSYALDGLARACAEAQPPADNSGIVTLSMLPSVAAKWLAPRLELFTRAHPEIDLRISASRSLVDFGKENIDGAIRYGPGTWPGCEAMFLAGETVRPVCAPESIKKFNLTNPADLQDAPLLHADIAEDWAAWFIAAGVTDPKIPRGPRLGDDTAILQAALLGQGVALGRSLLVVDDLAAGRLVTPFEVELEASYSYWFVNPADSSQSLIIVRDWIAQEFSSSR